MNQPTHALDWATIRTECPTAYAQLVAWCLKVPADIITEELKRASTAIIATAERNYLPSMRDLYDFFDAQGVRVFPNLLPVRPNITYWFACIVQKDIFDVDPIGPYEERPAAESAGFTAAFAVLEKQLNQKQA